MKAYWGNGGKAPHIPDLSTKCRLVVNLTLQQRGKIFDGAEDLRKMGIIKWKQKAYQSCV